MNAREPTCTHTHTHAHTRVRVMLQVFSFAVPVEQEAAAHSFVLAMAPGARLTYSVGGTLKYELPTTEVSLSRVFGAMAGSRSAGLAVLDWGVASATLEEVFIRYARLGGVVSTE